MLSIAIALAVSRNNFLVVYILCKKHTVYYTITIIVVVNSVTLL